MSLTIKNMAGNLCDIDLASISLSTLLDLKNLYIRKMFDEFKEQINLDKLIFMDENGEEMRPNEKRLRRCNITNGSTIYSFIVSSYIEDECLRMIPINISNDVFKSKFPKIKYNESLQVSYDDNKTKIESFCLMPPYIYKAISEKSLRDDCPSYFSIEYEKSQNNIVLILGDISIRFTGKESDTYSFKFEPLEKKLNFISESGIAKSLSSKSLCNNDNDFKIIINIENPGYRGNPTVYLRESKRKEVEKIENLFS